MDKDAIDAVVAFLRSALQSAGLQVDRLVLFGSQAKACARVDSDIDIIVISPDFRDKDIFQRVELTAPANRDTIRRFSVPLDLILMTPEEFESQTSPVAAFARESGAVYAS